MDTLATLTEAAQQAASAYETLERQTVEARRQQVIAYGQALLAIRKLLPNDQAFGRHIATHRLDIRNKVWRSDAMWLAKEGSTLLALLTQCPHSNPNQIRQWVRRQDPDYQPKSGTTTAGRSKPTQAVRDHVRPLVERGEPINVQQVASETGHSRIVVEAAIAAERGRKEGLDDAPVDILALADAMGLGQSAKDKLAALDRRLRKQHEVEFDARVSAAVQKHLKDYLLPKYNSLLTEADERLAKYKPPLSFPEYNTLIWALHEDQTDMARRAAAFALVHRLRVVLRGAEKDDLKPRTLPGSLAEMLARRRRPAA